jgi:hypothetical protein
MASALLIAGATLQYPLTRRAGYAERVHDRCILEDLQVDPGTYRATADQSPPAPG